jgi:hypothetical protein
MKKFYQLFRLCLLILFVQSSNLFSQTQQYLHFDRVDDFVEIPNASQYVANADAISMTGWFYCDQLAYGQGMLAFRNGGTGTGEMYLIQLADGIVECRFISTGGFHEVVTPAFTIVPQVWQHIAWVYDGSKVEFFVDGVSKGSAAASGTFTTLDKPLAIGKHISPWNFNYGGGIDEVTLWSKALTVDDIQAMMQDELNGDEPGLELYYKCDQGVPEADNTSITHLTSTVEPGIRDGELKNFALIGTTSNFLGDVNTGFQAISFPQIGNKLISDVPFDLEATASSGLPVSYEIVSGPATVSGSTVTVTGNVGEVIVRANQPGDMTYDAALPIENSFWVLDPNTTLPNSEGRSPLAGDVMVPELGPIQLASITTIDFQDLFSVDNVVFEINGDNIAATDWENEHYTGWWTPPAYGSYTMNIIATNNYGASSIESVNFNVVSTADNMTANAGEAIWLNVNIGDEYVEIDLPSYIGAFDEIIGNLDIDCPAGGCDPWDRISGVWVKGHNGEWYEIIRYITPYGVACNSSIDLTDFRSILQGRVTFRFHLGTQGNGFLYTLNLDYKAGDPDYNYSTISKLWNQTYDFGDPDNLQPTATINSNFPNNAKAAKLKLVSTGHGWGDNNTGNAAEFHEDTHHIWVNGSQTFEQHNWYVCNPNPDSCSPQNGTWFHNRAGWCPGAIAQWFDYDMTPLINNSIELQYRFDEGYTDLCHPNNPNCVTGVTCPDCNAGFNPHLIVSSYLITLGDSPVDVETGLFDVEKEVGFEMFPNPTDGILNIKLEESAKFFEISVRNNLGQIIQLLTLENTQEAQLNVEKFSTGIYFVEIRTEDGIGTEKVIVE